MSLLHTFEKAIRPRERFLLRGWQRRAEDEQSCPAPSDVYYAFRRALDAGIEDNPWNTQQQHQREELNYLLHTTKYVINQTRVQHYFYHVRK